MLLYVTYSNLETPSCTNILKKDWYLSVLQANGTSYHNTLLNAFFSSQTFNFMMWNMFWPIFNPVQKSSICQNPLLHCWLHKMWWPARASSKQWLNVIRIFNMHWEPNGFVAWFDSEREKDQPDLKKNYLYAWSSYRQFSKIWTEQSLNQYASLCGTCITMKYIAIYVSITYFLFKANNNP